MTHTPDRESFHFTIWIPTTNLSIMRIDFINTELVPCGSSTQIDIRSTYPIVTFSEWICIHNFIYIHAQLP